MSYMYNYDDQITIFIGKNAKNNWILFDKYKQLKDKSIFIAHLNSFSSGYAIIINNNQDKLTTRILKYVKMLLIKHSKISCHNIYKQIKIIYSNIKNVKKGKQLGEIIFLKEKIF